MVLGPLVSAYSRSLAVAPLPTKSLLAAVIAIGGDAVAQLSDGGGAGEAKGLEHLHLVTYTLATDAYVDHGPIFYSDRIGYPTYVNSIAVGGDGWVYALGRLPSGLTDLFRVADPHA